MKPTSKRRLAALFRQRRDLRERARSADDNAAAYLQGRRADTDMQLRIMRRRTP
jgi:hypothetical protein